MMLISKKFDTELVPVYNLEVEKDHTYFVGDDPENCLLVHNEYNNVSIETDHKAREESTKRILDMVRNNNKKILEDRIKSTVYNPHNGSEASDPFLMRQLDVAKVKKIIDLFGVVD